MLNPLHELIKLRIFEMTREPVKKELVLAQISTEFVAVDNDTVKNICAEMTMNQELTEVIFKLDDRGNRHIFVTNQCDVYLYINKVVHRFERKPKNENV